MAHQTLAPWAELVTDIPAPRNSDELMALPDDRSMYEMVEGRLVRMSPTNGGDSWIGMRLGSWVTAHVEERQLGLVTGADGEYVLSGPDEPMTAFAPDVAFVRAGRHPAPGSPNFHRIWHVAPDLVVEVVSPNQSRPAMAEKARRYLAAGVRLLWMVWPRRRQVDVWRPGSDSPVATLGENDFLDGLDVLPGFTHPVGRLFG